MSSKPHLPFALLSCVLAVSFVPVADGAAAHRDPPPRSAHLRLGDGGLDVSIRPDGGRDLPLRQRASGHWTFEGSTESLIGNPYTVILHNRTPYRVKVVVGIDGLNIYRKVPLTGRASHDVGSILAPWSRRELPGWQLDQSSAQRFVFSPRDWSEGSGLTESEIGTLRVEAYRERQPRRRSRWGREQGAERKETEGTLRPESMSRSAPGEPSIGTTSGDDIDHRVRTVRFEAATDHPEARAWIDYGRSDIRFDGPYDQLGLRLRAVPSGARILSVAGSGLGARAGLEPGDVILRIDASNNPTPNEVRDVWLGKRGGHYVFLRVRREHRDLALKVRI